MKILSITLRNFKGIQNFTLDTNGESVNIAGNNATGKTSIFDGFNWLLFDKDSQNKKDFQIKTLDVSGQVINGLEHEVEGTFEVDGNKLKLRKVYAEKWTKKRGSAQAVFSGHTTDYFIDDVPVSKKEYDAKIANIASENIFKLLTSPLFFNEQLHWQDRRKILLGVCGDISDEDVIASDKSLAALPAILNGRLLDDHRKVIVAQRTKINQELEKIPVRIDEVTKSLPDITGLNGSEIESNVTKLKAQLQEKNEEVARIQSGGEVAEKIKAVRELEAKIIDLKNEHQSENNEKVFGKKSELLDLKGRIGTLEQDVKQKQRIVSINEIYVREKDDRAAELRKQWHNTNNLKFEHDEQCTCPTCGQDLPEEKLAQTRKKALASFNLDKAQNLEKISNQGRAHKAEIEKLKAENAVLQNEINILQEQCSILQEQHTSLLAEIKEINESISDISSNTEYVNALAVKGDLQNQIEQLKRDNSELLVGVKKEIASIESDISFCAEQLALLEQYKKGQDRISELKVQEKKLAAEFEKLEGELYLTEQFIRSKVALLEERINSKFKYARFKLFEQQVNGGVSETCQVTFNGVPFESLNNAARINVGLDIINASSDHYCFTAPIFIDNAEAVVKLIKTKAQVIRLVVDGEVEELTISCSEIAIDNDLIAVDCEVI